MTADTHTAAPKAAAHAQEGAAGSGMIISMHGGTQVVSFRAKVLEFTANRIVFVEYGRKVALERTVPSSGVVTAAKSAPGIWWLTLTLDAARRCGVRTDRLTIKNREDV